MRPAILRFSEFAARLQRDPAHADPRAAEREVDAVSTEAAALVSRVGETTRAHLEAEQRYQRAVLAVEEEGVSEAEHERRVQEFRALRKKLEAGRSGPALSPSDARDHGLLEASMSTVGAWIWIETERLRGELECHTRTCAGKLRPRPAIERELEALQRLNDKLRKLSQASTNPSRPKPASKP